MENTARDRSIARAFAAISSAAALGIALLASGCHSRARSLAAPEPVDPTTTPETRALLASIHRLGWSDEIVLGQEMPATYSRAENFNDSLGSADIQDVAGDMPGLHGFDFHYIVTKPQNEGEAHIAAARQAYESGAIVTFNFHWLGKYSGTFRSHPEDEKILDRVVRNDDSRGDISWFYAELDEAIAIINDLGFPIVFRPLHEMNGDWFWWGRQIVGGAETYKRAFQIIVEYMSERTEYALFCWSPDKALPLEYYPGDEYVDIVGMDAYGIGLVEHMPVDRMASLLESLTDFAQERGKVAAFTETGATTDQSFDYTERAPRWWTENLLAAIHASEKTRKIAWVQTWINAPWSGPYVPHADASEASKEDFKAFVKTPGILLQSDVAKRRVYDAGAARGAD